MKSVAMIALLISQITYGQITDSIKKKAIDLQVRAWKAEVNKQFDLSIALADSSIALDSTRYEPYITKAESLWFLNRYGEAAESYKKQMHVKRPDLLIGSYVLLGMLYDKAGMVKDAKEQYSNAIKTWENGYQSPKYETTEEIEYVFAFGLLGNTKKWKVKLAELSKKYPSSNYKQFVNKTRQELLEQHFYPYGG